MKTSFWPTLGSFILSFMAMRIMSQTNLVMLAPLGQTVLAALAVPNRLMFIDSIVAFGIGPVASVLISKASESERPQIATKIISNTLFVGVITTALCLWAYPLLLGAFVSDTAVLELASIGIFWLTVSIPMRILVFVSTMCLFAAGVRSPVIRVYAITVVANAVLNWILIYVMGIGFAGSYIATVMVSAIELAWLLWALKKYVGLKILVRPDLGWVKSIMDKIGAEWVRLLSWQAEGVLTLAALTFIWYRPQELTAIAVTGEVTALLLMPLMALMRTVAVEQSNATTKSATFGAMVRRLAPAITSIAAAYAFVGLTMAVFSLTIGMSIYHLDGEALVWWREFTFVYVFALPLFVFSAVLRGWLQAEGAFSVLTKIEIAVTWCVFIPLMLAGAYLQNPLAFFGAYLFKEFCISLIALSRIVQDQAVVSEAVRSI